MTHAQMVSRSEWRKRVLKAYSYFSMPRNYAHRDATERYRIIIEICLGLMLNPVARAECFELNRLSVAELRAALATSDVMLADPLLKNRDHDKFSCYYGLGLAR